MTLDGADKGKDKKRERCQVNQTNQSPSEFNCIKKIYNQLFYRNFIFYTNAIIVNYYNPKPILCIYY